MELYRSVSSDVSRLITKRYSTSFSIATMLFGRNIRSHIYNIYGIVRVADEIVDTYNGKDTAELLDDFENEVEQALPRRYSTNPVIQAFVDTASKFNIGEDLIKPFFNSMRLDTKKKRYNQKEYEDYIYGSAEVVGLMCLRVFCFGNEDEYKKLVPGARALGSAFQKVNFLRDLASDKNSLERYYFPVGDFIDFDEKTKQQIIEDIESDFELAKDAISQLPTNSRVAVTVAYRYYLELLKKIKDTPASRLKMDRIRISDPKKISILVVTVLGQPFGRKSL